MQYLPHILSVIIKQRKVTNMNKNKKLRNPIMTGLFNFSCFVIDIILY